MRLGYIDIAKAIGIVLMVLLHTIDTYPSIHEYFSSFHMAIFFFVAGLFAKDKSVPIREITTKSFKQLLIPYFVFSLFSLIYAWNYPFRHPEIYHTQNDLLEIILKQLAGIVLMCDRITEYSFLPCEPLWFLCCLFWCRILFSVIIHHFSLTKKNVLINSLIISFLLGCYLLKISYFTFDSTAVSLPYFILGFIVNKYKILNLYNKQNLFIHLLILIGSLICIYELRGHYLIPDAATFTGNAGYAYVRSLLGIVAVMSASILINGLNIKIISSSLRYIGEATITILGLHLLVVALFKVSQVLIFKIEPNVILEIAVPLSFVCCLGLAILHHEFLQKRLPYLIGKNKKLHHDSISLNKEFLTAS